MITFYFIALIPIIIGSILFMCKKTVCWQEWIGGTVCALLLSAIMHGIAFYGMTDDIECWSGKITHACHFPRWVEEYQQRHEETYYTGSGENRKAHTRVWYTTEHATHSEHWAAYLNYGTYNEDKGISEELFNQIKVNFGNIIENGGKQWCTHGGHYDGGDNNIYRAPNRTGYVYPVTTVRHFENRIKAAPTLFSFVKVPTNVPVYLWPENPNWMASDRLLGVAGISPREFDLMNTRLGPIKLVNVIMINFGLKDSSIAQYQQAKFVGGKKNDLVLCYGQLNTNNVPSWSMVFGWTKDEICKRNLETILLTNPINNSIIPLIEKEIKTNYHIRDWNEFSYISIEPPKWAYWVLIITMILSQTGFYIWAHTNEFTKNQ